MKIEDTKIVLKVKSFKSGKYIKLLLVDSLEDFQNSVAPLIPVLMKSLRKNDGHTSLEKIKKYKQYLLQMGEILDQAAEMVESNVLPYMNHIHDESGKTITVDGSINYSIMPGDSVTIGDSPSSADAEVLEDLPDLEKDSFGVSSGSEESVMLSSDHTEE